MHISGKEFRGSGSPRFFPVIHARLGGLPRFPAPSAVLLGSPVLNPNLHSTFSWQATNKSPFTPFFPAVSLLHSSKLLRERALHRCHILHSSFLSCGKGSPKAMWFSLSPELPGSPSSPKLHGSRICYSKKYRHYRLGHQRILRK